MNTNNKRGFLLRAVQAKANKFNQEKKMSRVLLRGQINFEQNETSVNWSCENWLFFLETRQIFCL